MMRYDCVIFDLDGTLLDTLPDLISSVNHTLRLNGMPEKEAAFIRSMVANPGREFFRLCMPPEFANDADMIDRCYADFRRHYDVHLADETAPYNGVKELLSSLKKMGIKLAVISNKADHAVKMLIEKNFPAVFDGIIGEGNGLLPKPAPDMHLHLKEKLQFEQAIYVGDTEFDIRFARAIGIDCAAVSYGYREEDVLIAEKPDYIAADAEELLHALSANGISEDDHGKQKI